MHSHLRMQTAFEPFSAHTTAASYPHSVSPRPEKKQKMGIASTYRLAHRARGKLSYEASRGDHDLRLLVGHANLLDTLMVELQEAEEAETAYFSQHHIAAPATEEPRRVQWSDNIMEQHRLDVPDASDEEEEDSDSDSDFDEEEATIQPTVSRRQRAASPPPKPHHVYDEDEDLDEDMASDNEYDASLSLTRTRSHSPNDLPDLVHDSSDESDDESGPSSPDAMDMDRQQIIVKDYTAALKTQQRQLHMEATEALNEGAYFVQPHHQANPMVAAY